jgi:transcriptional regulator
VHHEEEWLRSQAAAVTNQYEASNGTNWEVSDSDPEYIERQLRAIVGLHIAVTDIQGSAKLSQNRPDDHAQVKENLSHGSLREQNVAQRMQL